DHSYPAEDAAGLHGFHASELPYMFGNIDRTTQYWPKPPATDAALSDAMVGYWSSFAATGVPTAKGQPAWQPYGTTGSYMDFTDSPHPADHVFPGMYDLNERVMCRRRANGDIPWHWNVGLASPPLPPPTPDCP